MKDYFIIKNKVFKTKDIVLIQKEDLYIDIFLNNYEFCIDDIDSKVEINNIFNTFYNELSNEFIITEDESIINPYYISCAEIYKDKDNYYLKVYYNNMINDDINKDIDYIFNLSKYMSDDIINNILVTIGSCYSIKELK